MGTKMKGLLKGLRYISQIFDSDKEQEMQIGLPTDVKHVAHIGWDGPSVSAPSWMKEFKSAPLSITDGSEAKDSAAARRRPADDTNTTSRRAGDLALPKPSKRNPSAGVSGLDSPKSSRQRRTKGGTSASAASGGDSAGQEQAGNPKQVRRKKPKAGSGGSSKSSRSKAAAAAPDEHGVETAASSLGEEEL